MKRFQTMGQAAGELRPFYKGVQKRIAALFAILVISMGGLSISANAEESDESATSETDTNDSAGQSITVSGAENTIITQEGGETSSELEGLYVDKYLSDNGDGTIQVTLESYVTGETTKIAASDPVDILLVLDASDSMKYSISDGTEDGEGETRLDALQAGAAGFVETIQELNTGLSEEDQSRIAIMSFNWTITYDSFCNEEGEYFMAVDNDDNASNAQTLLGYIENWETYLGAGTSTGDALITAQKILAEQAAGYADGEERDQVIIFFTDGWPTFHYVDGEQYIHGYAVSEAAEALTAAYQIKQSGVEIYCVSVLNGIETVDGEELPAYEKQGTEGSYEYTDPVHYLSDEMNTFLGEIYVKGSADYTKYVNATDENVRNLQTRFLYLLSSDNPDAEDIDDYGVTTGGYFYTAQDTESLTAVFEELATLVGTPGVELGTSAQIRDFITDAFEPAGEAQIFTADYNGDGGGDIDSGTWADPVEIEDPAAAGYVIETTSESITVSGFDYTANYVSDAPHGDREDAYYGCKLIITFPIRSSGNTFGGNCLPTNTTESGVYIDDAAQTPLALFPVPYADVEIIYAIEGEDAVYYVPDIAELSGVLGYAAGYLPDGDNNAYVDITYILTDTNGTVLGTLTIPAGSTAESAVWIWDEAYTDGTTALCGTYQITCMVTPVSEGTYDTVRAQAGGSVHIFYPELTLQDSTLAYGSTLDIQTGDLLDAEGLGVHYVYLQWVCEDGCTRSAEEGPVLGYRTAVSEGVETDDDGETVIATKEDVPIILGVYRVSDDALADDVTLYTVFHHACSLTDCGYSIEGMSDLGIRCLIHVTDASSGAAEPSEDEETDNAVTDSADDEAQTNAASAETVTYTTQATDSISDTAETVTEEETEEIIVTTESTPFAGESDTEETVSAPTRDVPPTGDEAEILFWFLCMVLSAMALVMISHRILSRRK